MLISSAFYQTAQTPANPDCSETAVSLSTALCCKSLQTEFAEAHKHHSKPRFPSKACMGSLFSPFGLVYIHFIYLYGCRSLYCVNI